jgi:hypothetical protein
MAIPSGFITNSRMSGWLVSTHPKHVTQLAPPSSNLAHEQHADFVTSLKQATLSSNMFGVHALTQHKAHLRAIMGEIAER